MKKALELINFSLNISITEIKKVQQTTWFEVYAGIVVNLTSGWIGILLISPGVLGVANATEYVRLLVVNVPMTVIGITIAGILMAKSKEEAK